jgi:hypothetical protein
MKVIPRIHLTQRTLDVLFDFIILVSSILTLLFVISSIIPIIILLPDYWIRPFVELLLLGYLGVRGMLLWKKEVK